MSDNLILLADDNPDHVLLATEALESGVNAPHVLAVTDGQQLLDYLHHAIEPGSDQLPQLIVLDLQMPRVDGFEVLRQVKQDERFRTIPIVVLTTSGSAEDIERSYDLGSNSYVQKPTEPGALHDTVAQIPPYWFDVNELPEPA
jgi:two-component system response regulator